MKIRLMHYIADGLLIVQEIFIKQIWLPSVLQKDPVRAAAYLVPAISSGMIQSNRADESFHFRFCFTHIAQRAVCSVAYCSQ